MSAVSIGHMKMKLALAVMAFGFSLSGIASGQSSPSLIVTSINPNPVMLNGAPGFWDGVDVMNPSVFAFQGQLVDYYSGWDGTAWRTGVAVSNDNGQTWQRIGGPIISPGTGGWATKYIAANGSTIEFNGQILTYYHGMEADGWSRIGLSFADPAHQLTQTQLPNPVVNVGGVNDYDARHAADPFVMQSGNQLVMYYGAVATDWSTSIMQAVSFNGTDWLKNEVPVMRVDTSSQWESGGIGEPDVFTYGGTYFMIYTGSTPDHYRSLMWATSPDGYTWTKQGIIMAQNLRPAFASQVMADPSVVPTSTPGQFEVFYGGGNLPQGSENLNGRIGLLTIQVSP